MVVVVVRYHHRINEGYLVDVAGRWVVPSWSEPRGWSAAVCEDRVEEHAEAGGEFNEETGVAEPGRAKRRCFAGWEKLWGVDRDCWRCGVGAIASAGDTPPGSIFEIRGQCEFISNDVLQHGSKDLENAAIQERVPGVPEASASLLVVLFVFHIFRFSARQMRGRNNGCIEHRCGR